MHQDPKYYLVAINRASGKPIPRHIPLMLLAAKDLLSAGSVNHYGDACADNGLDRTTESARERHHAFTTFAAEHPEEMKLPSGALYGDVRTTQLLASGGAVIERPYTYVLGDETTIVQFVRPGASGAMLPGTTTEEVLDMLIDRVITQDAMSPCDENKDVLLHLQAARTRQVARMTRLAAEKRALAAMAEQGTPMQPPGGPGALEQFGILMTPCASSNLEAHGYRPADQTLALRFRGGRIYHYPHVPQIVYDLMLAADSKGSYAAREISGKYEGIAQVADATTATA